MDQSLAIHPAWSAVALLRCRADSLYKLGAKLIADIFLEKFSFSSASPRRHVKAK